MRVASSLECIRLKRNFLLQFALVFLLAIFSRGALAGEDYRYLKEMNELALKIKKILIDEKICKSEKDCNAGLYSFVGPYKSGMSIETYGIRSQAVLMKIVNAASSLFFSNEKMNVVMSSYWMSKREHMSYFFLTSPDPFLHIEFLEKNK